MKLFQGAPVAIDKRFEKLPGVRWYVCMVVVLSEGKTRREMELSEWKIITFLEGLESGLYQLSLAP